MLSLLYLYMFIVVHNAIQYMYTYVHVHTLNIALSETSAGEGRQSIAKCLMKRGVTGLRPPPGGAQPAHIVISLKK